MFKISPNIFTCSGTGSGTYSLAHFLLYTVPTFFTRLGAGSGSEWYNLALPKQFEKN